MTCQLCGYEFTDESDTEKMKDVIAHYQINHTATEMLYDFYLRLT